MISFIISILVLIIGYFTYGKLVEKIFGVQEHRKTPAIRLRDDVDYMPLSTWRVFMIQFLNIAGLGPIFGAIAGAMYGPAAPSCGSGCTSAPSCAGTASIRRTGTHD